MLMIRAVYNCSANVAHLAVKISKSLPGAGYLASLSPLLSLSSEISLATTSGWSSRFSDLSVPVNYLVWM